MSATCREYVLSLPRRLTESVCHEVMDELLYVSDNSKILIDFSHINKVDYFFLNSLVFLKKCFYSNKNEIHFVNYSDELKSLFEEINLKKFMELPNLVHA